MSKILIKAGIIFLMMFMGVFAAEAQQFNAGLQFGLTATQVTGDNLAGYNKPGLFGGGFVNYPLGDRGKMQLEINFIQKGSRKNAKPSDGIYDSYLMRLHYIEVPVFYHHKIRSIFGLGAGLAPAVLIAHSERDNYGIFQPDPSVPAFKTFELPLLIVADIRLNEHWFLGFRYSYSLLPIRQTPLIPSLYYNGGQYNDVLITLLQYHF